MGFALCELGLTLRDYNRMSWAEFLIRSTGFRRMQEYEQMLFREIAYSSYVSGWMGKGKPPRKEKFWPIGTSKKSTLTASQKAAIERARKIRREKNGNS